MVFKAVAVATCGGVLVTAFGATLLHAQAPKPAPGYVVAEFTIKDPDGFPQYAQGVPPTLSGHGGRFIVRPGNIEGLKGDAPKGPFAVIAFDSVEQAKKWASSPEYTALVPLRDRAAEARLFIVEGVPSSQ
jgi:uncharacterized protein (DUF1330 family)